MKSDWEGRLDCTNIIRPDLSIITNISFDHMQFLGNTLAQIATEKAGIIKRGIPVVVGETTEETKPVFYRKAQEMEAPITFAEEEQRLKGATKFKNSRGSKTGTAIQIISRIPQQKKIQSILPAGSTKMMHIPGWKEYWEARTN